MSFSTGFFSARPEPDPTREMPRYSWRVATQHRGQWSDRFIIACLGVICAGTIACGSTSASQGGLDFGVSFPLRDAQRCHPRLVNRR